MANAVATAVETQDATQGQQLTRRPPGILEPRFSRVGLVVGALFFAASMGPSLLPRAHWQQGVLSGITLAIGYGLGTAGEWVWRGLGIRPLRGRARRVVHVGVVGAITLAVLLAAWQYVGWQNDLRAIFGMPSVSPSGWPVLVVVTVLVSALLLVVARLLRRLFAFVVRFLRRFLPPRLATALGVGGLVVLLGLLYSGVLVQGFWAATSAVFAPRNDLNKSGVTGPPTSPLRSGGPDSLVTWPSLGREGRAFVSLGPTREQLAVYAPDRSAKEPIRVFAGLESAPSVQERADLVLAELKRTGAFDREILVLATTTGSGFIDPAGIDPLEYLWHGDTAVAGVQYSYLPSWLSLLADQDNVQSAARTVFRTVQEYWQTLPQDRRPRIYLYGLSLGSFGVQSVLTNIELLNLPIDGAFMSGPPFVNPLHAELTANRDPGSPHWRPVYQQGRTVRFTAQEPVLESLPGQWGPTRVAYLQHGSDPVVNFSPRLFLHRPEWLDPGERAPDVSPRVDWYPVVTGWATLFDLTQAGTVPWGFGHLYSPSENTYAWVAVSQPPGWSDAAVADLADALDRTVGG